MSGTNLSDAIRLTLALACMTLLNGCQRKTQPPTRSESTAPAVEASSSVATADPPTQESILAAARRAAFAAAQAQIATEQQSPGLSGALKFEQNRAAMVGRAKSEPAFFIRTPQLDVDASTEAKALRLHLEQTEYAWRAVRELLAALKRRRALAREVLLLEGYLYSEEPNLAFSLVSQLRPTDLFDSEELWIHRGSTQMRAKKDPKQGYVYVDGPEAGQRVRLLHLDRLSAGAPSEPALHRDFRSLRANLHFEQARVRHITEQHLVTELRYGPHWIPTLLRSEGTSLSLQAEAIDPSIHDDLTAVRNRLERKARAVSALRGAMRDMIDEGLPFDEPKTEVGQEDGKLRPEWLAAYRSGRTTFRYNDDRYSVFDSRGRPRVPQVCIDFMVDTFERAGGAWWRPRADKRREKTQGRLDLSPFNRSRLRQTAYFVQLARERDDMFEVRDFAEAERIELGYKETFFKWIQQNVHEFEPGDIILIRGLTPWDPVDEHTHSFFIYETDPISGVPIAIAGNAGPANLWSWETEARRTPHRTVRTRLRPRLEWLESFIDTRPGTPLVPPVLVSGKR